MTSKKRKADREWKAEKQKEIDSLKAEVQRAHENARDAQRARTEFPHRLAVDEHADGGFVDGFVKFPDPNYGSRFCNVPVLERYPNYGFGSLPISNMRAHDLKFIAVEHAVEVQVNRDRTRVRWWNWELKEPGGKVEVTISHAADHLRLALHEHMMKMSYEESLRPDGPVISAVRNALDEMSLLNGNQIGRMNHRVLEQRSIGMNRYRGRKFSDG